jgi:L-threonylcarbamoyladenylate synthase
VISSGGVVILPTETVYGLVGDVSTAEVLKRIRRIKRRTPDKPISVFVNGEILERLFPAGMPRLCRRLADRFWPGPLTLVVPYKGERYRHLAAPNGKIGLRFSSCRLIQEILARVGSPLSATSANLSGEERRYAFEEILEVFAAEVDLIVKDEGEEMQRPSTVLEVDGEKVRIIREGVVSIEKIKSSLPPIDWQLVESDGEERR